MIIAFHTKICQLFSLSLLFLLTYNNFTITIVIFQAKNYDKVILYKTNVS